MSHKICFGYTGIRQYSGVGMSLWVAEAYFWADFKYFTYNLVKTFDTILACILYSAFSVGQPVLKEMELAHADYFCE